MFFSHGHSESQISCTRSLSRTTNSRCDASVSYILRRHDRISLERAAQQVSDFARQAGRFTLFLFSYARSRLCLQWKRRKKERIYECVHEPTKNPFYFPGHKLIRLRKSHYSHHMHAGVRDCISPAEAATEWKRKPQNQLDNWFLVLRAPHEIQFLTKVSRTHKAVEINMGRPLLDMDYG